MDEKKTEGLNLSRVKRAVFEHLFYEQAVDVLLACDTSKLHGTGVPLEVLRGNPGYINLIYKQADRHHLRVTVTPYDLYALLHFNDTVEVLVPWGAVTMIATQPGSNVVVVFDDASAEAKPILGIGTPVEQAKEGDEGVGMLLNDVPGVVDLGAARARKFRGKP